MHEPLDTFKNEFPSVWATYEAMRNVCDQQGPLDRKTVELIKVGVSVALDRHGGLIAHISQAQRAGAQEAEIYHAILTTMSLAGFPATLGAFATAREHLASKD
jgi:AhpD family alkylhydroperoxidase